ncbi:MAG: hypothetical protein M3014_08490, partial [Chloroflexota bacterium]|nr:hypothetical protein [Chloroflexota bacterium]
MTHIFAVVGRMIISGVRSRQNYTLNYLATAGWELNLMRTRSRSNLFILILLVGFALFSPGVSFAHEKWFVDSKQYPVLYGLLFSLPVLVAAFAAGLALAILFLLRRRVRNPLFPDPRWLQPVNSSVQAVVGIQTAISLVYMAVQGWLLAPSLLLPQSYWAFGLLALQIVISFTFITGWL